MLHRVTTWHDDDNNVRQIEVCILDELWEPLWKRFLTLGPFDDPAEARAGLLEEGRSWFHLHGDQRSLGW